MQRIVFIAGLPRSGTTFLTEVLLTDHRCQLCLDYPYESRYLKFASILEGFLDSRQWPVTSLGTFNRESSEWLFELTREYVENIKQRIQREYYSKIYLEKVHGHLPVDVLPDIPTQCVVVDRGVVDHYRSCHTWRKKHKVLGDQFKTVDDYLAWRVNQQYPVPPSAIRIKYEDLVAGRLKPLADLYLDLDFDLAIRRSQKYAEQHRPPLDCELSEGERRRLQEFEESHPSCYISTASTHL